MTRNNMIKKIEIISPGTGLCPNRFSEVNFTLVETESLIFKDIAPGNPKCYKLQHNTGLEWFIIDYCLMNMHAGECCKFLVNYFDQMIYLSVQLNSFSLAKDCLSMKASEKHEMAHKMKLLGTESLKCKNYLIAAEKYGLAFKLLISDECTGADESNQEQIMQVMESHEDQITQVRLNLSLCFMKLNIPEGVLHHCDSIVSYIYSSKDAAKTNYVIKVLYRRAWAFCQINEYEKCKVDINKVLALDPDNKDTLQLLSVLDNKIKHSDQVMSNNLRNMFK